MGSCCVIVIDMSKRILFLFIGAVVTLSMAAQDRTVQNRPYADLRPFHFGVVIGTHLQDIELTNVGPLSIADEDGTVHESLITADQDRWDPGFTVGVLGEFRLSTHFQLRVAPALYFGTRHFTFHNFRPEGTEQEYLEERQNLKTAYISSAVDLIFAAPRFNNHRPYLMAGVNPMINLSGRDNDYLKLKRYDVFLELGVGCDFYMPFFKLRPELKFMFGLTDCLDKKHGENLRNPAMQAYTNAVSSAHSKMITLCFYFE